MSHAASPADVQVTTLAVLALGELTTFERCATDAQFAPSMKDKVGLAGLAGHALDHYDGFAARIEVLGGDVVGLMQSIEPSYTTFQERTRPRDWYESLMKSYVLDGIMRDFHRAALVNLDESSREVATAALDDTRQADFLRIRLTEAKAEEAELSSRLALWGRRLVGEALTLGRGVILGFGLAADDETLSAILQSVTTHHSQRMSALGLVS